jgi:hypothetical protein
MTSADPFRVPINGFVMQLRRSELEAVAAGLSEFDVSDEGNLISLAEALRALPSIDRAPAWELLIRRYGRHKPPAQASAEIGMDLIRARDLLSRFSQLLAPSTSGRGFIKG